MKLNILKRAGMLAASTAVCCGVVFGGLSMNGLRYVRPTAENWTLLAYMQPAARIEQQKSLTEILLHCSCNEHRDTFIRKRHLDSHKSEHRETAFQASESSG